MFGYIYVNEPELKIKEYAEYRSFYCGLCHTLQRRYGRMAQMMLNYDMTFLAILLTGLYEPETVAEEHRCIPHPVMSHRMSFNDAVEYAADMCVLLSYQKLKDDWLDEGKLIGRTGAVLLRKGYVRAAKQYPRQAKAIAHNIHLLRKAEEEQCMDLHYVAGLTGNFLAEIYVWKEDEWQDEMRTMGYCIGKFVYLLDALEDVEKDKKKQNYNLFLDQTPIWNTPKEGVIREILTDLMAEAARAFERLPVLAYAEIIRNILYSGVWCKYAMMRNPKEKKRKDRPADGVGGEYEKSV